jgi:membrane protease YdiL (CAAX protease family)
MNFWARRPVSRNLIGAALVLLSTGMLIALSFACGVPTVWLPEILYGAVLLATLAVARLYDHLPAAWVGLAPQPWTGRELLQGAIYGTGLALLAWAPIAAFGSVTPDRTHALLGSEAIVVAVIIVNAAGEEILFRGYLFQRLMEIIGPVGATILAAGLFSAAHFLDGRTPTVFSVLNIFLAGTFFTLGYLRTGSLWFPIASHAAWNLVHGKIVGLPVSGLDFGASVLRTLPSGPEWLTGGSFGAEGSLTTTIAMTAGILLLARSRRVMLSPYVHASVFRAFYRNQRAGIAVESDAGG